MTEYDNNNRGALWNNDRKQSDKHPDLSGSIMIDGKEYEGPLKVSTRWALKELSLAPIGADPLAKARAEQPKHNSTKMPALSGLIRGMSRMKHPKSNRSMK